MPNSELMTLKHLKSLREANREMAAEQSAADPAHTEQPEGVEPKPANPRTGRSKAAKPSQPKSQAKTPSTSKAQTSKEAGSKAAPPKKTPSKQGSAGKKVAAATPEVETPPTPPTPSASTPSTPQLPAGPAPAPIVAPAVEPPRTVQAPAAPQEKAPSAGRRRRGGRGGSQPGSRAVASEAQPGQDGSAGQAKSAPRRWYTVDLHMHTPASNDYEDPQVSYLEWLRVVADRGMEIVAITDHNTVAGIAAIRREVERLTWLQEQNRLTDAERSALTAWRDLSNKVLLLPGFEFTATFGFHILGIFPPETSTRTLEHILLSLKVPPDKLDIGSTETGASTDVLTAYRVIHEAGGLVIAAHANSTHGVAMRNFPFGGQTKIAYTQDANLDALEVTDLEQRGYSTARFFNGSKSEYARRMHCIQGSDSHRVTADPRNPRRLGIGERATEMFLDSSSFEALAAMLRSTAFERTRPARPKDRPFDPLVAAREEGASIVQSFHESAARAGGHLEAIVMDVCAFANTAGGTIYVGATPRSNKPPGVARPKQVLEQILEAVASRVTPPVEVRGEIVKSENAAVLRLRVPKGDDRPYCLDEQRFFVRGEAETNLAVRDEIIAMVLEGMNQPDVGLETGLDLAPASPAPEGSGATVQPDASGQAKSRKGRGGKTPPATAASMPRTAIAAMDAAASAVDPNDAFYLPQIGVEIVESEQRHGSWYHSIRDLRNGNVIRNVTRRGARDLWNYAIRMQEEHPFDPAAIRWKGDRGLLHVEKRAGKVRYDLALREDGRVRYFYGVTEDGMEGTWANFVQEDGA